MSEVRYSEYRSPRQMLAHQEYDGHLSIHDDAMAENLGFAGAPIEGPTHFSQYVHLATDYFGDAWFERGCISAHYQNMVVEGEEVRAFIEIPEPGATTIRIGAEKRDGTPVLTGTASVGPDYGETELDMRMAKLKPSDQLVILSDLTVGQKGAGNPESVIMGLDDHMGDLYPFSLAQKLGVITESHDYYTDSPFGGAVVPMEMISVLVQYTSHRSGFKTRGPAIGLFAAQQIKLVNGPILVGVPYLVEREIIALSESRRTESNWIKMSVYSEDHATLVAEVILNSATMKESYADYAKDAQALGKDLSA